MSRKDCFIANLKHLFTACLPLKTNCITLTINAGIKRNEKKNDKAIYVRRRHFLRRNLFIDPVQILSPHYHYIQNA